MLVHQQSDWFVIFEFDKIGYVKDDEKDSIDSEYLLESLRKGTEKSNKIRRERGFPELSVVDWKVKPNYNDATLANSFYQTDRRILLIYLRYCSLRTVLEKLIGNLDGFGYLQSLDLGGQIRCLRIM